MALYAKVPTKSVRKISNDVIKTDKKKTQTAKRKESYVSRIDINSTFMIGSIFNKINFSTYLFELLHLLKNIYLFRGSSDNYNQTYGIIGFRSL